MKILLISSEAAPLVKVGGLADVSGALPKALNAFGHDVRVIIPQYNNLNMAQLPINRVISNTIVMPGKDQQSINLNMLTIDNVPFYLLENEKYFKSPEIYKNELERFYFFSRAVFELLPKMSWQPEIIHCQDWMTGLVILWSKLAGYPYRTVFTIHNLNYQGSFDEHFAYCPNLLSDWQQSSLEVPRLPNCFMAPALKLADRVTTVSPTYAREIVTPEFGVGIDSLIRARHEGVLGILNGIDVEVWNPLTDRNLVSNYDPSSWSLRSVNKTALQKSVGLTEDLSVPLLGMVQRLDEQKGLDILIEGLDNLLQGQTLQLVIVGRGAEYYESNFKGIATRFPRRVAFINDFAEPLAHLIYGGCDLFMMPSRFEPCGLGQMIALRYGALPLVRHTGGLVDSTTEFNSDLSRGNGFVFHEYSAAALNESIKKALSYYHNRKLWTAAAERVSRLDFSWARSARQYEELYNALQGQTLQH